MFPTVAQSPVRMAHATYNRFAIVSSPETVHHTRSIHIPQDLASINSNCCLTAMSKIVSSRAQKQGHWQAKVKQKLKRYIHLSHIDMLCILKTLCQRPRGVHSSSHWQSLFAWFAFSIMLTSPRRLAGEMFACGILNRLLEHAHSSHTVS